MAQSIGGGGGNGGMNLLGSVNLGSGQPSQNQCDGLGGDTCTDSDKTNSQVEQRNPSTAGQSPMAVNIAIGGSGGTAGNGSKASIVHTGNIVTDGNESAGILAQSIGGGGGNAGINLGLGYLAGDDAMSTNVALGGGPGDGGSGDDVEVVHTGDIATSGYHSTAIYAQSIGGGGGDVALNFVTGMSKRGALTITLGRTGSTGGAAGDVRLTSDGAIATQGDDSIGLFAQSVGNGGGDSSQSSISLTGQDTSRPKQERKSAALTLSQGLEGGDGGSGGDVMVKASGSVQTQGTQAHAIFAQSVGGGGGLSSLKVHPSKMASNLSLSQGSSGGNGAASGTVTVDNAARLATAGSHARGISAQSIGGGGGNSRVSVDGRLQMAQGNTLMAMGGNGGTGAHSGAVAVSNGGIITTLGEQATGIYAQSIGGGGGDSDLALLGQLMAQQAYSPGLLMAVGGSGGSGGSAGATSVVNSGAIATQGTDAAGIIAQSIGGGGGNGSVELQMLSGATLAGPRMSLAVGGSGGNGSTGGKVTVTNTAGATIATAGDGAQGILAQSIGGGGGNSQVTVTTVGAGGVLNFGGTLTVGGNAGKGGSGADVEVDNDGLIETVGDHAAAIVAESIGGGGGNSEVRWLDGIDLSRPTGTTGTSPLLVVGGTGGDGNDAGAVTVVNDGSIVTHGKASNAIVARSIGGGGGQADMQVWAYSGTALDASLEQADAAILLSSPLASRLGGSDGSGGQGGAVSVVHTGDITLLGEDSQAIIAQSINGGGGDIRFELDGTTRLTDMAGFTFDLGAENVTDSIASRVTITSTGSLTIAGDNNIGQAEQSVGGGGGSLAFHLDSDADATAGATAATTLPVAVQMGATGGHDLDGGDIASQHTGDIVSLGEHAPAQLLQTIGGGGGRAVLDLSTGSLAQVPSLTLGALGSTQAAGGTLDLKRSGDIATYGNRSMGMIAQSIGGGGGSVMLSMGGSTASASGSPASVLLGAQSGQQLDGGNLTLALDGNLYTAGNLSHALFMQSIGGGGGLAVLEGAGSQTLDVALGATDAATGNGGDITLSNSGNVETRGATAYAVFLQSIGGGGGAVFTDAPASVTLRDGGSGDGGTIRLTQSGSIEALGSQAIGIFAQSLGGGGGMVNRAFAGTAGGSGHGGGISLEIDGDVVASGTGGVAVFAQSQGPDGNGDIHIDLASEHRVLGGPGGHAIELRGGADNLVVNRGYLGTTEGIDGIAILGEASPATSHDTIVNHGAVTGSIQLAGNDNLFRNEEHAVFDAGSQVALGADGSLVNLGILRPGGADRLLNVDVDGQFLQGASGRTFLQYDLSRASPDRVADRVSVSGSAVLSGSFTLSLDNPGYVQPGHFEDVVFSAEGGVTGPLGGTPKQRLDGVPVSVVGRFQLGHPNANEIVLDTRIDFAPAGLNRNQASIGEYVNRVQLAGGSRAFAPLAANFLFARNLGELQRDYDALNPVVYAESLAHVLLQSMRFSNRTLGCDPYGLDDRSGPDGECRWFRLRRHYFDRDATAAHFGHAGNATELNGGFQVPLAPGSRLAVGLSFDRGSSTTGLHSRDDSDLLQLGATISQQLKKWTLAGNLSAGHAWLRARRLIDVPGTGPGMANSRPEVDYFALHASISRTIAFDNWYLRPIAGAGLTSLDMDRFSEAGRPVTGVAVGGQSHLYPSLQATLEFGGRFKPGRETLVSPYASVGLRHFPEAPPQITARLLGTPSGAAPFTVTSGMDSTYGVIALGLNILSSSRSRVRLEGNDRISQHGNAYGFSVRLRVGLP